MQIPFPCSSRVVDKSSTMARMLLRPCQVMTPLASIVTVWATEPSAACWTSMVWAISPSDVLRLSTTDSICVTPNPLSREGRGQLDSRHIHTVDKGGTAIDFYFA